MAGLVLVAAFSMFILNFGSFWLYSIRKLFIVHNVFETKISRDVKQQKKKNNDHHDRCRRRHEKWQERVREWLNIERAKVPYATQYTIRNSHCKCFRHVYGSPPHHVSMCVVCGLAYADRASACLCTKWEWAWEGQHDEIQCARTSYDIRFECVSSVSEVWEKEKSRRKLKNRTCMYSLDRIGLYGVVSVTSNQFIQRHSADQVCT